MIWMALVSAGLLMPAWAATVAVKPVVTAMPKGNALVGKEKADAERCIECHGLDGQGGGHLSGPEGKFAKLAGQYPAYVLKQFRDFRSGARKHDQMAIMARSVDDPDVIDIAAYFASLPPMKGDDASVSVSPQLGKALYEQGDARRGIAACASCHGLKGEGLPGSPLTPVIGGQAWRYLDEQLRDWRSGQRRNSADGAMNNVTRALPDAEVESLAAYLSGL